MSVKKNNVVDLSMFKESEKRKEKEREKRSAEIRRTHVLNTLADYKLEEVLNVLDRKLKAMKVELKEEGGR
jgi:hypothetical protein